LLLAAAHAAFFSDVEWFHNSRVTPSPAAFHSRDEHRAARATSLRNALARSKCIFFLTFGASDSIYESQCDFSNRKFELGESIDEERNQEGRCEEKGCSEEKEVARQRPEQDVNCVTPGPRQRGLFYFVRETPDSTPYFAKHRIAVFRDTR
jgi:hypothetical protein